MDKQPTALRMADDLEAHVGGNIAYRSAAELRLLHTQNQELVDALSMVLDDPQALDGRPRTYEYVCEVLAKHKEQPMTTEHLPKYIATTGVKPMEGGGGGGAQPKQEPVAWWNPTTDNASTDPYYRKSKECIPLYTAPPSKPWVGLTGLEVSHYNSRLSGSGVAEEIEAALRSRNNG